MAARYYIENGDTVSEVMPLDWEGGLATVLFFDALGAPDGRERVLPPNTSYIVAITNSGGGNARCRYFLDWYEGGTDLPIKPQ